MRKVKVYSERRNRAIRFAWFDAKCEFELRKALGVKEKELPALLFFQGGSFNRTFNYTGGLDEIKMRQEVDKLDAGRITGGVPAVFSFTDRDCVAFHKDIDDLVKANPDTTRKQALEEFLEKEQKLHAEGKDTSRGRKRKSKKSDL